MKHLQRIDWIALALVVGTCATWWLGEGGRGAQTRGLFLAVMALAAFKGVLIALEFMELRHAPALWRRAVLGWLCVVLVVIAVLQWARIA